ncbi:DoxX family protein [Nocardia sp. SSK8]|uniref:DoxX family protein n=1 Tax=Nocardia sp. SSK8 TaxID=3120154 RepID=UPI00300AC3B7
MTTATAEQTHDDLTDPPAPAPAWHPVALLAFRFTVAYLGLFCVWMAQITFVFAGWFTTVLPQEAVVWQIRALEPVSGWLGEHVFGVDAEVVMTGSGDLAAIWIQLGLVLVAALVITAVWSVLDRRRRAYPWLAAWALTGLRLAVGGQMLFYGFNKLIPLQMPEPGLLTLISRVGDLSPMGMLWTQVGSSPAYQIALGAAEVLAGMLLFWPRTATLGAMLSVISMAQVFLLNLTFDVPVKILSGHLLLMSLVLLAPQARRLVNVLVLERDSAPMTQPALFTAPRANRWATGVQLALCLWITAGLVVMGVESWHEYGGGAPKPELYGIWDVTEYTVGTETLPPLTTDPVRWQRLIVDTGGSVVQHMDGRVVPVLTTLDPDTHTLTVIPAAGQPDSPPIATFAVDRPTEDRLLLRGDLAGAPGAVSLTRFDHESLPLRGTGFHWVQNAPNSGG